LKSKDIYPAMKFQYFEEGEHGSSTAEFPC
jgi:hypothetical protein